MKGLRGMSAASLCLLLCACGGGGGGGETPKPAPTLSLSAGITAAEYRGTTKLTWSSTNASSCTAAGNWIGARAVTGEETTAELIDSSTFTLSCSGEGGSATQSVTVSVAALPPDPGEAGKTTVAGIDSNGNGVRDDAERYVLQNTTPGTMRQMLLSRAKLFQSTLIQSTPSTLPDSLMRNLECLYSLDESAARAQSAGLLAEVVNTEARAEAYIAFDVAIGAVVVDVHDPSDFSQSCTLPMGV